MLVSAGNPACCAAAISGNASSVSGSRRTNSLQTGWDCGEEKN
ncbi:hypothetical protein ACFS07_22490 [Undibacterium arcticum]